MQQSINRFTPVAEINLHDRPGSIIGEKAVGRGRFDRVKTTYPHCIIAVRWRGSILSLASSVATLPTVEVGMEREAGKQLTLAQATTMCLRDSLGILGAIDRQRLVGVFMSNGRLASNYVVNYFPNEKELGIILNTSAVWLNAKTVTRREPDVPVELLKLLLVMGPEAELGYDVDGRLALWTPELELQVHMASRSTRHQQLAA